ncbi:MAG TPA: hypothetical protein VEW68_00365 [Patescibacteria group bacterium]|nr:hypothetical protein [Patescibacteria group bacterium]
MEARATFGRPAISKMVWAIVALAAAGLLGGSGAYALKAATSTTPATAHIVQGVGAWDLGSAWNYTSRRSGAQSVEGPAAADQSSVTPYRAGPQLVP